MDYLDRNKEIRQRILLFAGYLLIGTAIVFSAYLLKNQAEGFGIDRKGNVTQSGLTFFSSHPSPANIYVNGRLSSVKTNTRLALLSGIYNIKLTRTGYYDWQRKIEVSGGDVQHFDYPFLFPKTLSTDKVGSFPIASSLMTQSPDRRWLLIKNASDQTTFTLYDLKNPGQPATSLSLPLAQVSRPTSAETWSSVEWADDNKHVVLMHAFDNKSEFILVDRDAPAQSINLNSALKINPTKLTLSDKKYDQYYVYDASTRVLQKISQNDPTAAPVLSSVLAYKTYGDDTVLYVTDKAAPNNKVLVRMLVGKDSYNIRPLSAGTTYCLDLTKYEGAMYVVAAAASDQRAYIFKDPVAQRQAQPAQAPFTSQVLRVPNISYVSFSPTAQYIVGQGGNRFGVYDIENKNGYNYTTREPIDSPQPNASWMDGNRLQYISAGKLNVFDFDYTNLHVLMPASSNYLPAFSPDYKFLYSLGPSQAVAGQLDLSQTWLRTLQDR